MMGDSDRQYELVLLGANGYTGRVTAGYITTHLPTDLRWAIAGRSESKLSDLAKELRALNPDRLQPGIEVVQLKPEQLDSLAQKTRLVITMVGPYALYGTPVVEACAKNGTHYIDITGETPWVREIIEKYHDTATQTGAIIIPEAGFESTPADLLSWALVSAIREKMSTGTEEVILSVHELKAGVSGGTLETLLTTLEKYSLKEINEASQPWSLCHIPGQAYDNPAGMLGVRKVPDLGVLAFSFNEKPDRAIVHRSWGLHENGTFYGRKFRFSEYVKVPNALIGALIQLGVTVAMTLLLIPPMRHLVRRLVHAPGSGPSSEDAKKQLFEHRAIGVPERASSSSTSSSSSSSTQRAFGRMRYEGGIYNVTGIFVTEAAMVILRGPKDILARKLGGGILTPSTLGQPFIDRLIQAGVTFETKWI